MKDLIAMALDKVNDAQNILEHLIDINNEEKSNVPCRNIMRIHKICSNQALRHKADALGFLHGYLDFSLLDANKCFFKNDTEILLWIHDAKIVRINYDGIRIQGKINGKEKFLKFEFNKE